MRETCWCGHPEEDHDGTYCAGIWYDTELSMTSRCRCGGHYDNTESTWTSYKSLHIEVMADKKNNYSFWRQLKIWLHI